jgi:hypothetical protein
MADINRLAGIAHQLKHLPRCMTFLARQKSATTVYGNNLVFNKDFYHDPYQQRVNYEFFALDEDEQAFSS